MVPWDKLPKEVRKTILVVLALTSSAATAGCGPIVCDPAPPPTTTPAPPITPIICDPSPPPMTATPTPTATRTLTPTPTVTRTLTPTPTATRTPLIFDPAPAPSSQRSQTAALGYEALPLAEIRTVTIVPGRGLSFRAETPWPGAQWRWSVSSGTLRLRGARVTWQPPAEPGRYLLQVAADWGATGLAVDACVLEVGLDGRVTCV